MKKSLDWNYQFGQSPLLAAKTSVTQLTHRNDEYIKFDYSGMLNRKPKAVTISKSDSSEIPDSRLIGSAVHLLISRLELSEPITKMAIEKVKEKLLSEQSITQNVAKLIDAESIVTFFNSELGGMALDSKNRVYREWPFTFSLPTSIVSDDNLRDLQVKNEKEQKNDGDFVIVQGIIDLLICTPKKLIIVDFKTDKITADQTQKQADFYRKQLDIYSRAAVAILNYKSITLQFFLTPYFISIIFLTCVFLPVFSS